MLEMKKPITKYQTIAKKMAEKNFWPPRDTAEKIELYYTEVLRQISKSQIDNIHTPLVNVRIIEGRIVYTDTKELRGALKARLEGRKLSIEGS